MPHRSVQLPLFAHKLALLTALCAAACHPSNQGSATTKTPPTPHSVKPGWELFADSRINSKPYFHLAPPGRAPLTEAGPEDHPWHYGLWFSWKHINGANYWEEERTSGNAEGSTTWTEPERSLEANGSTRIVFHLQYTHPSGRIDLKELRTLVVSAPSADGAYTIDWQAKFTAGAQGALLDRTPMPNEPNGKIYGGYGGLSLRLTPRGTVTFSTEKDTVDEFVDNRARPSSRSVAANFTDRGKSLGAISLRTLVPETTTPPTWYIVRNESLPMRFIGATVLAPHPIALAPGEALALHYQIQVSPIPIVPSR